MNYVPNLHTQFEFETETQLETRFKYCRIVLKADKLDLPLFEISTADGENGGGNIRMLSFEPSVIDKEASENWDNIRVILDQTPGTGKEVFSFAYSCYDIYNDDRDTFLAGNNLCGNAIISYKQDSKWLRSTEKLLVWTEDEIGNRDNVVRSYSPNDPKYLNNAAK